MAFIPVQSKRTATPAIPRFEVSHFRGVDFSNAPANVDGSRSPDCVNFIRESFGKIRKRTGYRAVLSLGGKIFGAYSLKKAAATLLVVHHGSKLSLLKADGSTQLLYSAMAAARSIAFQMSDKLYLFDGSSMTVFDGTTAKSGLLNAYVPTVLIGRAPSGGGEAFEYVNLLSPLRKESFLGTASDTIYQLSATGLDGTTVTVESMQSGGSWSTLSEGAHYTLNRGTGQVIMLAAKPPILTGEDNIRITYSKTVAGYSDRILKCTAGALYGVSGGRDRLFLSGNNGHSGYVWFSDFQKPSYFPDLNYLVMGQDGSHVFGFAIVGNSLAIIKNGAEDGTNTYLISGSMTSDNKPRFLTVGAYQGLGAVSKYSFGYCENEPVFLSAEGVKAISPSDVLGERFAQDRSFFLNGRLTLEKDLQNAFAFVYDGFYFLALGRRIYILDSSYYDRDKNAPFSHRQYDGYYWELGEAVCVLFERDGALYAGTEGGQLLEFYSDYANGKHYSDGGAAILARWSSKEFYGSQFYFKKNFSRLYVLVGSAVATGVRAWAQHSGIRELLAEYNGQARYLDFSAINFNKFSFKTDKSPQTLMEKIKIKKVHSVRFVLENDVLHEPLGLYNAVFEYVESR